MKKVCLPLALASGLVLSLNPQAHAQYADSVISYVPGTGIAAGYTNTAAALGAPASGSSVTPFAPAYSKSQLVSIGAGGEITLQLSTPATNDPSDPYGINFMVFANEFFVDNSSAEATSLYYHTATAVIQVSNDDSTWYTLNPALAPQAGELFPTYGGGNAQAAVNPALTASSFTGDTLAQIEALYGGSAGGTGYDLAWAEDANSNSVDLASADYVRIEVETGVLDLDAISVVPEPKTWALASLGLGIFFFPRRKKMLTAGRARKLAYFSLALLGLASVPAGRATTLTENFSANPSSNGWQVYGDTNLFQWDNVNQNLEVTWDSTQTNSYFYHPLGTILTRNDDFSLSFDMQLNVAEASNYGSELALGLFNLSEATNADFQRSTGENSPNLVEFDYFPDVGYGPTLWPQFVDTNSLFNYNGSSDYAIYAPILGDWYHVVMTYTASNQTMVTTLTNFEQTSGITVLDPLMAGFTDFRVDTLSISSYQDDGYGDSVYAQGVLDNFTVTLPPPAIQNLVGAFTNSTWQVQFNSQTNWVYTLERTTDFQTWTSVSALTFGNADTLYLQDTNPVLSQAYYRVNANRP